MEFLILIPIGEADGFNLFTMNEMQFMNNPHACIPKADDSSPSIDESSVSISINICSQEKTLLQ